MSMQENLTEIRQGESVQVSYVLFLRKMMLQLGLTIVLLLSPTQEGGNEGSL